MAVGFSVASFGRSFVAPVSSGVRPWVSLRRVFRVFAAARARWPSGRLAVSGLSLSWVVPAGVGGAPLVGASWGWGRDGFSGPGLLARLRCRVCLPRDLREEIALFGLDVPASGVGLWREWVSVAWSCAFGRRVVG